MSRKAGPSTRKLDPEVVALAERGEESRKRMLDLKLQVRMLSVWAETRGCTIHEIADSYENECARLRNEAEVAKLVKRIRERKP